MGDLGSSESPGRGEASTYLHVQLVAGCGEWEVQVHQLQGGMEKTKATTQSLSSDRSASDWQRCRRHCQSVPWAKLLERKRRSKRALLLWGERERSPFVRPPKPHLEVPRADLLAPECVSRADLTIARAERAKEKTQDFGIRWYQARRS